MTLPGATNLGFTGIGKETVRGTPVGATAYIPVMSMDPEDSVDMLQDTGMRASMASLFGVVKGTTHSTCDLQGDVYADIIGYPLAGVFGADAVTGASAPYTHLFTLLNTGTGQGPSYTLVDYTGIQTRQYAASVFSSLSLRASANELFTYQASTSGNASTIFSKPTPSFSTVPAMAAWIGTATIGGSAVTTVEDAEVTITRNVTLVRTVDGIANPYTIWQGPLSISGSLTFVAPDETEFLRYLNLTNPSLVLNFQQGAGAALQQVQVQCTAVNYNSAKPEKGNDYTQFSVQWDAIANATDAGASGGLSPGRVTVQNAVAAGSYI
uniref:phage tail tube protein n=1 Tax=Pseudonocardia sp. CA-138482 TaxID=3240023 RepID=UPI003F4924BE